MAEATTESGDWVVKGPQLWALLHRWALSADPASGRRWLGEFEWKIGCNECRLHWSRWVAEHPPALSGREALFAWTVEAHNAVSRRLGKPEMDLKSALERWSSPPAAVSGVPQPHAPPPGEVASANPDALPVNCIHAGPGHKPTAVTCALGLYGGRPHIVICKQCQKRVPRNATAPAIAEPRIETRSPSGERHLPAPAGSPQPERLVLSSHLSPGDILMLTAAVRDLHRGYPGRFETAIETPTPELWEHNPWIARPIDVGGEWRRIEMQYPLINHSNQRPVHFIQGYADYLSSQLGIPIPVTEFRGDIHMTQEEKSWMNQVQEQLGYEGRFWIIVAGGKHDFTAKWWPPAYAQQVVDHFLGRLQFVQCGQQGHWHRPLRGAFNLIGRTSIRQFIRLMYHAEGVICPVSFAMHLAAAVPTKKDRLRPCIVLAGGREPPHWEAYPGHQFLHTIGCLPCCATGGCWRSRCQLVGDGDRKDVDNVCVRPVQIEPDLRVPQCMAMVQPSDVIRAVERYINYGD